MLALWPALFALFLFFLAYHFYGKWIGKHLLELKDENQTPAHLKCDGVEYVPTNRYVLFGHHFASIAGLGPILGPAIAVIWGWLPAMLWVVFGSILIGAVHDLTSLGISLRHEGKSIGEVTSSVIGERAKLLFLLIIFFVLSLAMGVFALVIAQVFTYFHPQAVLPTVFLMLIALFMGIGVYRWRVPLWLATLIGIPLVFFSLFLGVWKPIALYPLFLSPSAKEEIQKLEKQGKWKELGFVTDPGQSSLEKTKRIYPLSVIYRENQRLEREKKASIVFEVFDPFKAGHMVRFFEEQGKKEMAEDVRQAGAKAAELWIVLLLIYALVASVLPVWLLLQPRDYLNSFQLYAGILLLYGGMMVGIPSIVAPSWNSQAFLFSSHPLTQIPPLFPFLFITVACGAVSGFHCLVASGTTVRQLKRESDAPFVAYGGMLAEGLLAVGVILACTAGYASQEAWSYFYRDWSAMRGLGAKLAAFVSGAATFLHSLGIPKDIGKTFIALVVISFAMTTLDSATRLLRYNVEELGRSFSLSPLQNRYVSSLAAVLAIAFFGFMKIGGKPAGLVLWGLFGTSNQLLGGIALLVVTIYLYKKGKKVRYTLLPMLFLFTMTLMAMVLNWWGFWKAKSLPLLVVGGLLLGMTFWLIGEAFLAYKKARQESQGRETL